MKIAQTRHGLWALLPTCFLLSSRAAHASTMHPHNPTLPYAAVLCVLVGLCLFGLGRRQGGRVRWLLDSRAPTDGRRWVAGASDAGPVTVYMATTDDHYNAGQSYTVKSTIAPWSGFSPSHLTLATPEGERQVDLRGALFLAPLDPARIWARPNLIEEALAAGGFRLAPVDAGAAPPSFSPPPPRGAKLFQRTLPAGAALQVCGRVAGAQVVGGGAAQPLLVALPGEEDAGLRFVSGFFNRNQGLFFVSGAILLFAAAVFAVLALR